MYAIIETGGKQYRVAPGEKVRVESITANIDETLELTGAGIKAVSNSDGQLLIGNDITNAKVTATVTKEGRGAKIVVFKFKRKKQYRRTYGHRQNYTELVINDITL
ncbi:MAG: 50S ribosomal protein L21 [Bryobacteraceae bacterium]|nr:50S ribosomal protein L21 [Bryobacteraceae bacterium]